MGSDYALSSQGLNPLAVGSHWRCLTRRAGTREAFDKWFSKYNYSKTLCIQAEVSQLQYYKAELVVPSEIHIDIS